MAEAGIPANEEPRENVKSTDWLIGLFNHVKEMCLLFDRSHFTGSCRLARFNKDETELIFQQNDWDLGRTVNYALNTPAEDISRFLQEVDERQGEWQQVRPRNRRQRREDAIRNQDLRQLAAQHEVPSEVRQFACEPCDKTWWRRVPVRKMVSRCHRCRRRYDALPRELEWGWAKFICPCTYAFHGFGAMGRTLCLCYRCKKPVWPDSIIPPKQKKEIEQERGRYQGRRRDLHSCLGPNCYNRTMFTPHLGFNLDELICVHPKSLDRAVVEESELHQSTGSTINSFLCQGDLDTHDPLGVYIPREPSIREDDEEDGQ